MTISSSMNASVAGLAANASRLATISDNISNSSTYGYKRAVTNFESMVIDNGQGAYTAGGVRTTTMRLVDEGGGLVTTSNSTDLAIRGRGMLPVTSETSVALDNGENPLLLTTTGSFRSNDEGYLVSAEGLVLMGVPASSDGTIPNYARDSIDGIEPVRINASQFAGEATTAVTLSVNLPATATQEDSTGDSESLTIEYFDNLGTSANLGLEFTPTVPTTGSSNEWTLTIRDSESDTDLDGVDDIVGQYTLQFDDSRTGGGTLLSVTDIVGGGYDDTEGSFTIDVDGGPIEIGIGALGSASGLTQLSDAFAPVSIAKNGTPVGTLSSIEIDESGFVRGSYDIGINRVLYQIPLVDVPNVNGLEALDQQVYSVTPESGTFFLWDAGDGPTGDIISYAREESATDVAGELTDLIQTQRAYSSNAKVIQTVDEMLQETTNIKR